MSTASGISSSSDSASSYLLDYLKKKKASEDSASSSTSSGSSVDLNLLDYLNSDSSSNSGSDSATTITDGLTNLASFISAADSLSADQKKELASIFKEAQAELKSGNFDAAKLADSASSSLTSALKDSGVDLKSVLSSYQDVYNASTTASSNTTDYTSLLSSSGVNKKLYSVITTLINRDLATDTSDQG